MKTTCRVHLAGGREVVVDGLHSDIRSIVSDAIRAGDAIVTLPGLDGPVHVFISHIQTIQDDPFQKLMGRRS